MVEKNLNRLLLYKFLLKQNHNALKSSRSTIVESENLTHNWPQCLNKTIKSTCKLFEYFKCVPIPGVEPGPPG